MGTVRPLRADTGLCQYDEADTWFSNHRFTRLKAAAICANCPIIVSCAQRALTLNATDGVWASVPLPSSRDNVALEEARKRLHDVIDLYQHQPAELRRRSLRIRQAVHFAAIQRELSRHSTAAADVGSALPTEKASA